MKLPENKRRTLDAVRKRTIWIYGAPFSGKTTFANNFPDPLMLNTDGNIKFVDAPYLYMRDNVRVEGRQTKTTLAWEIFKDTVAELEKKENTFKTIVVDLLEDMYEHCRIYICDRQGWKHESDDSFRAWDMVRGEFFHVLRRLMNLDYENIILISHENTSRDLTRKGGDKISAISPNLPEKVAVKVAGMVDLVARIVADGDAHSFCFKSNEVIFGGGRLTVDHRDIPLDVDELFKVYDEANARAASGANISSGKSSGRGGRKKKDAQETPAAASYSTQDGTNDEGAGKDTPAEKTPAEGAETPATDAPQDEPPRRRRKKADPPAEQPAEDQEAEEDASRSAAEDIDLMFLVMEPEAEQPHDLDVYAVPQGNLPMVDPGNVNPADMVECPDAERIFRQFRDSKGEIPLCKFIDAAHKCHRYNAPAVACPLLDKQSAAAPAKTDTQAQDTPAEEKPRRRRKVRE